jgi:2-polyprenyl-3-methyl-5-hydroxy-6-metoxy-1,4-benzoquinol methylase
MSITDPTKTMILLHELFWFKLLRGYYQKLVASLDLNGDEKVLDFGCGPGAASKWVALNLEKGNGELTCFDISEKWIKRAKKKLNRFSNVKFYAVDIRDWHERNEYYDIVFIHFMLHDIPQSERPENIKTLAQKMSADATLIIREPTKERHGMPPEEIRSLMCTSYTGFFKKQKEISEHA